MFEIFGTKKESKHSRKQLLKQIQDLKLLHEKQLLLERREKNLLKNLLTYKQVNKSQIFYVETTEDNFKNNIFKIGRSPKKKFNVEKVNAKSFYVCYYETYNSKIVENIVNCYLKQFVYSENQFKVDLKHLKKILTEVVSFENKIGDYLKFSYDDMLTSAY